MQDKNLGLFVKREKWIWIDRGKAAWIWPRQVATRRGLSRNYSDFNAPTVHKRCSLGWCPAVCGYLHVPSLLVLVCAADMCAYVVWLRTQTKPKFSHSVTSFRSKLLHTSQWLSTETDFYFRSRFFYLLLLLHSRREITSMYIKSMNNPELLNKRVIIYIYV